MSTTINLTTPGTTTWTVPSGVTSVGIVAIGAGGGGALATGNGVANGGAGCKVTTTYTVVPGQVYTYSWWRWWTGRKCCSI